MSAETLHSLDSQLQHKRARDLDELDLDLATAAVAEIPAIRGELSALDKRLSAIGVSGIIDLDELDGDYLAALKLYRRCVERAAIREYIERHGGTP